MSARGLLATMIIVVVVLLGAVRVTTGAWSSWLPVWQIHSHRVLGAGDPAYGSPPPAHDVVCSDTNLSDPAEEPSCPPPSPNWIPSRGSDTTGEEPAQSPVSGVAPSDIARSVAIEYETARSFGDWTTAWSMLSAYSQGVIGSLTSYEELEKAYNAEGGTTFNVQDPTQNPDLLAPEFLGLAYLDAQATADIRRAWLVFVEHPHVRGASASSVGLLVAPIAGHWYVWIAH